MGSVKVCVGLVRLFGNQHVGTSNAKGRVGGLNEPIDQLGLIYVFKCVNKIIELLFIVIFLNGLQHTEGHLKL